MADEERVEGCTGCTHPDRGGRHEMYSDSSGMWCRACGWSDPPRVPQDWTPHFNSYRHSSGCDVSYKTGQLHVAEVYTSATKPVGFSVPLPVLRALLLSQGLHIVSEAEMRVLEAMGKAMIGGDTEGGYFLSSTSPVCQLELAHRAAKRETT